jgi:hypothetical protein
MESVESVDRKLDRLLDLLSDAFLTPDELREVLRVKLLAREGRLIEETVAVENLW